MTHLALRALALLVVASWFGISAALAENRIALVIGNSAYRTVSVLPNPANDARAMTALLTSAGFEVVQAPNQTLNDMRTTISSFAAKVAAKGPDTVALVFYAGHGLQVDGENFLVPIDVSVEREADVPVQALRLSDVMNVLSSVPAKTRIVMLDACRNNPFSEINKTAGRGLAIVDAPAGSIVSYSTSPGATAEDGAGADSPYTTAILSVARVPGVPIEQAFKRVRLAVHQSTDGRQTPWESTSLATDFAFFPGPGGLPPRPAQAGADGQGGGAAALSSGRNIDFWRKALQGAKPNEAYEIVIREDTPEAYEAFLALFGQAQFGVRVRSLLDRRTEMTAWYVAVGLNTLASYQVFLTTYPNSDYASTARKLQERLRNRSLGADAFASAPVSTPNRVASTSPAATCSCSPAPTKRAETPQKRAEPVRRGSRMPTDDDIARSGRPVGGSPRGDPGAAAATGILIGIGASQIMRRSHPCH